MIVPHTVSAAIRGDLEDHELCLDILAVVLSLPLDEQRFLELYSFGYSPHEAVEIMQARKSPQHWFNQIIRMVCEGLNK